MNAFFKHVVGILYSIALCFVGGMICGAVILSLCSLSGRIQTTGEEYVGYWEVGTLLVGAMYGGPVGAIIGPIAYLGIIRTTGFERAVIPAFVGTIIAGFLGSIFTPMFGLPAGIIGFFIALLIVRFRHVKATSTSNAS